LARPMPLDRVGRGRNTNADANDNRVVNGEDAAKDKYPWVVALDAQVKGDASTYSCGGTLIAPGYILTAAHCFYPAKSGNTGKAYFGSHKTCFYGDCDAEERTLVKAFIHPNYNGDTSENDVAILKLNKPVTSITPVPLRKEAYTAAQNFGNHGDAVTLGWGTVNTNTEQMADVLQQGAVGLVNRNTCWKSHSYSKNEILEGMVCASQPSKGTDACQGDSGGPLFVPSTGEQVGVVSWGEGCGKKKYPGVYADVGHYYSWINGIADLEGGDNNNGGGGGGNTKTTTAAATTTTTTAKEQDTTTTSNTATSSATTTTSSAAPAACECKNKWSYDAPDGSGYTTYSGCASTSGDNKDHWCYTEGECAGSAASKLFDGWHWAECTADEEDDDVCSSIWNGKKCNKQTEGKCMWKRGVCMAKPTPGTCSALKRKRCNKDTTAEGTRCQYYGGLCQDLLVCDPGTNSCCGKGKNGCNKDSKCEFARKKTCMPIPGTDDDDAGYAYDFGYY